jgi:hypothetical protein
MYIMLLNLGIFLLNIIISIIIIYSCHQLWIYIKDNYSTKKTKDLVNTQIQKYQKMMKEIQDNNNQAKFLDNSEKNNMDQRLTDFMNNIS